MFSIGSEDVLREIVEIARKDVEARKELQGDQPLDGKDVKALCDWSSAMVGVENVRKRSKGAQDMSDEELQKKLLELKDDPEIQAVLKGGL